MKKQAAVTAVLVGAALVLLYGLSAGIGRFLPGVGWITAAVTTLLAVGFGTVFFLSRRRGVRLLELFAGAVDSRQQALLEAFPLAAAAFSPVGELIYYNDRFEREILSVSGEEKMTGALRGCFPAPRWIRQ